MIAKAICHVVIICKAEVEDTEQGARIKVGKPEVIPHTIISNLDPTGERKFSEDEIHALLIHAAIQSAAAESKPPERASLDKVYTSDDPSNGPVN
jgi:hypothetical protein